MINILFQTGHAVAQFVAASRYETEGRRFDPLWPPTRRRAVQWISANVVFFRTQLQRELTLHDLMDFMKRTKWKMYQRSNRRECVANYLTVIDTER